MLVAYVGVDGFMSMIEHSQAIQNYHNTRFSGKEDASGECKVGIETNYL